MGHGAVSEAGALQHEPPSRSNRDGAMRSIFDCSTDRGSQEAPAMLVSLVHSKDPHPLGRTT